MGDDDRLRPAYHFAPQSGWINDPAGLVRFGDTWHLYYQYNPDIAIWGNIHWGHAESEDLLSWTPREPALRPHPTLGLVFTGSAVVDQKDASGLCGGASCIAALFTHALGQDNKQKQSLAVSPDGRTFSLYDKNPVIPNPGITDFRDPKVVWHPGTGRWALVLAAGDRAKIYTSKNLKDWTFRSDFGPIKSFGAWIWECPDLFPLAVEGSGGEQRWVLKTDITAGPGNKGEGRYFVGTFDGSTFTNQGPAEGRRCDFGNDFYAAQSFSGVDDGRTVWLAWQNSWHYALATPTTSWRGSMTLPRELSLVRSGQDLLLRQRPARELAALRGSCTLEVPAGTRVSGVSALLDEARGSELEIEAELSLDPGAEVVFSLLAGDAEQTLVGYDAAKGSLYVDRTKSGNTTFHKAFARKESAALPLDAGRLKLRIFIDRSSLEVYGGDGMVVISHLVFPSAKSDRLGLEVKGGTTTVHTLRIHRLALPSAP